MRMIRIRASQNENGCGAVNSSTFLCRFRPNQLLRSCSLLAYLHLVRFHVNTNMYSIPYRLGTFPLTSPHNFVNYTLKGETVPIGYHRVCFRQGWNALFLENELPYGSKYAFVRLTQSITQSCLNAFFSCLNSIVRD